MPVGAESTESPAAPCGSPTPAASSLPGWRIAAVRPISVGRTTEDVPAGTYECPFFSAACTALRGRLRLTERHAEGCSEDPAGDDKNPVKYFLRKSERPAPPAVCSCSAVVNACRRRTRWAPPRSGTAGRPPARREPTDGSGSRAASARHPRPAGADDPRCRPRQHDRVLAGVKARRCAPLQSPFHASLHLLTLPWRISPTRDSTTGCLDIRRPAHAESMTALTGFVSEQCYRSAHGPALRGRPARRPPSAAARGIRKT